MNKHNRNKAHAAETAMANKLDDLARFEEYEQTILPKLRKAISEGWTPEKIYKEFGSIVAGRAVTLALTAERPTEALAAITEVLNRGHGKAVEKIETTHKYEKLTDEQLDEMLRTAMAEELN